MVDEGQEPMKAKGDVDEEMTLVVPPPKSSKLSGEQGKDQQGDITMDNPEQPEPGQEGAEKVDPKVKAVTGTIVSFTSG